MICSWIELARSSYGNHCKTIVFHKGSETDPNGRIPMEIITKYYKPSVFHKGCDTDPKGFDRDAYAIPFPIELKQLGISMESIAQPLFSKRVLVK